MKSKLTRPRLGIIGGSGLYDIDGLEELHWRRIDSPWGEASDEFMFGRLGKTELVFLPRHGRGHRLSPSDINYRANIDCLKRAGVTDIVSLSACGSFRESLPPGTFVIIDQFVDRTVSRPASFFGTGMVAHVSMAHPVCPRLGGWCEAAARAAGAPVRRGGTYLAMEGPQFSSLAESNLYRAWGMDVIGMTNLPEARLAREAELCYATVAMVTDFDCWHPEHDKVEVQSIIAVLLANADKGRALVRALAPHLGERPAVCPHGCDRALEHALITAPEARDPELLARLDAVAGRVLSRA
jgi:5'-methylthioadenosine phosphorylase